MASFKSFKKHMMKDKYVCWNNKLCVFSHDDAVEIKNNGIYKQRYYLPFYAEIKKSGRWCTGCFDLINDYIIPYMFLEEGL